MNSSLPVVVIGAGPVGLAAAAHLHQRQIPVLILEAGPAVGAGIAAWSQVRMFSPWHYSIDSAAAALLTQDRWKAPHSDGFPTGAELVRDYLEPLARTPPIAAALRLASKVVAITRDGRDVMSDSDRAQRPFLVRYVDPDGEHELLARAVIDASGTINQPSPLGASGIPALGEAAAADRIHYGIADVLDAQRLRYAGQRVLVVGSGHSAFNVLQDLSRLAAETGTQVHWALRRPNLNRVLGGGENDQLAERGKLGLRIGQLVSAGEIQLHPGYALQRIERTADGLRVHGSGSSEPIEVDQIIACTGFRPDLQILAELRLDLDPATQSARALAPLIDPNQHSCGSVRPHGAEQLQHPERDFYIVGMKSYGRAPTFLLATGYEQVRSVVAAIDGDWEAARRVDLVLPETGVCITQFLDFEPAAAAKADAASCCGDQQPCPCGPRNAKPKQHAATGCCG